jgi:hypothetical protein
MLFTKGLRNIIQHQLNDAEFDSAAGIRSFVTLKGKLFSIAIISRILIPVEIVLIAGFIFFLSLFFNQWFFFLFSAYLLYCFLICLFSKKNIAELLRTTLLNNFYEDLFPLFLIILLAQNDKYYYILLAIHFFIFRKKPLFLLLKRAFDLIMVHYVFHGFIVWLYYKGFCNRYALKFYRFLGFRNKAL